jgi:hypothetical protein
VYHDREARVHFALLIVRGSRRQRSSGGRSHQRTEEEQSRFPFRLRSLLPGYDYHQFAQLLMNSPDTTSNILCQARHPGIQDTCARVCHCRWLRRRSRSSDIPNGTSTGDDRFPSHQGCPGISGALSSRSLFGWFRYPRNESMRA